MPWLWLTLAGLLEIVWAIGLKYTDGFTRPLPSVITVLAMIGSVYFLALAVRSIPIGTGYAVWTGIGAVGVAILGMILFDEPARCCASVRSFSSLPASRGSSWSLVNPMSRPTDPHPSRSAQGRVRVGQARQAHPPSGGRGNRGLQHDPGRRQGDGLPFRRQGQPRPPGCAPQPADARRRSNSSSLR